MNVLVACEESQRVCLAFRERGHNAYSCDILECSGSAPQWHIQGDVLQYLNPGISGVSFYTCDGVWHLITGWDLIIAFPPCTFLTVTGNRWFNVSRYGDKAIERLHNREKAVDFFLKIVSANCPCIAIENPIGVMSTIYKKPSQIVQPWQFAYSYDEYYQKSTCLWLKGLPKLVPFNTLDDIGLTFHEWETSSGKKKRQSQWYYQTRCLPHKLRAVLASKTPFGLSRAMAEQWG